MSNDSRTTENLPVESGVPGLTTDQLISLNTARCVESLR